MNPVARRNDRTNSRHHGKKLQEDALIAIEEMYVRTPTETWSFVVKSAKEEHCIPVPDNTIRRWWLHFEEYGEYPFETRKTMKFLRKLGKKFKRTKVVTEDIVQCLKLITEEHPEFYIDEIQMAVCVQKRVFISEATLTRVLKEKLGYSLQVCYDSALQRSQSQRALYKASLKGLVRNANQLIFVDETHKDKAASRRRKAWGIRNSGGIGIQRWFKNEARYTMIASLDINGFVPSTIECVLRDEISAEGAAGTVNAGYFEIWVEHFLCPVLGNYANGEPRSIVVLDNASTHMHPRVSEMIRSTGAVIIYTAPYSPDLNPIELAFNIYKSHLKRLETAFRMDWFGTHINALNKITRDTCIKEYRRCGVPKGDEIFTMGELNELSILAIGASLVVETNV
uniref:Tc1-like transposase DDE domain-containing protein n=1 Tax=Chaetoceros debilis TaxID=122233 RepID=A0A7S3V5Z9_9STRA|mmetsp:Transcript_15810/g.23699  ORF Transcript_15810/g.23699 Transcript_15810/m.23699 type:complete len:397 (+) Transcript_15810:139-1329(+)